MRIAITRVGIVLAAVIALIAAATAIFVLHPVSTGMPPGEAFAAFQSGSRTGVAIWTTVWFSVVAAVAVGAWIAIGRRGPDLRVLAAVAWVCLVAAVALLVSYLPFVTVDLGMDKVLMTALQDRGASMAALRGVWLTGAGLGVLAIVSGAAAGAIDARRRSTAPASPASGR